MKIRVSNHVACAWNWGLGYDEAHEEDTSGFRVTLMKSHPGWELAREVISHLPGFLPSVVADTAWYERMDERFSANIVDLPIDAETAVELYHPFWQIINSRKPEE